MNIKTKQMITKIIYLMLGLLLLAGGIAALFFPEMLLPETSGEKLANALVIEEALIHIAQESGAVSIALGALLFWAIFNIDKMAQLNYIFLLFFLIFGGIHWLEYVEGNRDILSPQINSLPALFMGIVIWLREELSNVN